MQSTTGIANIPKRAIANGVQERRHTNPEAGPSKPPSTETTRSEPQNNDFYRFLAGQHHRELSYTTLPLEANSLITHRYYDLGDDPTPGGKAKGKEDDLPEVQGHCEGCNAQLPEVGSELGYPKSSALITEILKRSNSESQYRPVTGRRLMADANGYFREWRWSKECTRPLHTPPPSPHRSEYEGIVQSEAIEELGGIQASGELYAEWLHTYHRRGGLLFRWRASHRELERWIKKLLRAVRKLRESLEKTIASCLIIDQVLEVVSRVAERLKMGDAGQKVEKAQSARKAAKDLCCGLKERSSRSIKT